MNAGTEATQTVVDENKRPVDLFLGKQSSLGKNEKGEAKLTLVFALHRSYIEPIYRGNEKNL
jgi:hypothetical protein